MTALRDAVARAICSAEGLDWDLQSGLGSGNGDEQAQEAYLMLADAAIAAVFAAIREPTPAMLHAATMIPPTWDDDVSRAKWQTMLTTAERTAADGKGE